VAQPLSGQRRAGPGGSRPLGTAPRGGSRGRGDRDADTAAEEKLAVTHWSTRLLAAELKISHKTVARAWKAYGIKPWKAQSFRFSIDPELVGKVTDICGLYLGTNADIPANAIWNARTSLYGVQRVQCPTDIRSVRGIQTH